jgi:hypothetical protein
MLATLTQGSAPPTLQSFLDSLFDMLATLTQGSAPPTL